MSAPLTVLSVLVSRDPGLDLRVEHSHGWGDNNQARQDTCIIWTKEPMVVFKILFLTLLQGGHYHYDTTPEEVEYLGYYNTAQVHNIKVKGQVYIELQEQTFGLVMKDHSIKRAT